MENRKKKVSSMSWIFPDILGDNHTNRIYMALILFSSYLLIFKQVSINKENNEFLSKYDIKSPEEVPEKFLLIEKEFFGLRDEIKANLSFKDYKSTQNQLKNNPKPGNMLENYDSSNLDPEININSPY